MSGLIRGTFGGIRAWADLAGSLNEKAALWTAVTVVWERLEICLA